MNDLQQQLIEFANHIERLRRDGEVANELEASPENYTKLAQVYSGVPSLLAYHLNMLCSAAGITLQKNPETGDWEGYKPPRMV